MITRAYIQGVGHGRHGPEERALIEGLGMRGIAVEPFTRKQVARRGTAGYGLDLGGLDDGRTALVEWNDGFSLGNDGLDADAYTGLILARWCELVG